MSTDTKTALLDSAEKAARMRGFDGFSYADLSRDVGIRKASIHHHFPTKAALSIALIARYKTRIEEACAVLDTENALGADRIRALIDIYRNALDGGKSMCLCAAFSTSRDSLPAEVISEVKAFRMMILEWLAAAFELGQADGSIVSVVDPKREAAATLPLLEGAQLSARTEVDADVFENAVGLLLNRLTR